MHAYVINLARSVDRRTHITAELKKTGLDYEIFTAVDGRELDMADASIIDPSFLNKGVFPAGSAGCALSHVGVYRRIIEDGLNVALILEDDVTLPPDLAALADSVAEQLVGAEAALLSVDCPDPCEVSREGSVRLSSSRLLALPIDVTQLRSTGAYVITREACERMIKCVLPIRAQADAWSWFYREGALDRVRCVTPLPVLKSPDLTSTIGYYSLGDGLRSRLVGPLVRNKIPIVHQALAYRRKRILRQWGRVEIVSRPFVEMPSRLD